MSGGVFNYDQHRIQNIIESLESFVDHYENGVRDSYDNSVNEDYSNKVLKSVKETIPILKESYIRSHRLDYLFSGDDGEDSYFRRLTDELNKLKNNE